MFCLLIHQGAKESTTDEGGPSAAGGLPAPAIQPMSTGNKITYELASISADGREGGAHL